MVIKWLHRLLTIVLALMVGGFLLYQYYINGQPDDSLAFKKQVSGDVWLYVTKYNGGGATVSDVYRYYLDGPIADDSQVMKAISERQPFLVSDTDSATVTGYASTVNIRLNGRVYSYTNSDVFYVNGVAILPVININAYGTH
ncbi:hypothetical protein [Lelliottia sp. CFBP8978]|uniref:hypothetical protein n=1 Tax=Lelliottia sp. CFBP8978 TaxID=3096522 RepID=UPI002A6ACB5E|nr:hypothetical protein [Lelliottia sp. CFBP8978]